MNVEQYFKTVKGRVLFIGDTLEIFIPTRYEMHGCLEIGDTVTTLGIFDLVINGKIKYGFELPAKLSIEHSHIEMVMRNGTRFVKLTLRTNDVFMSSTNVVKDESLAYVVFYELVYGGKHPEYMGYEGMATIFNTVMDVTGIRFPTDKATIELFPSALYRDAEDLNTPYRLSKGSGAPTVLPLSLVSHAASSTTARIVGSYHDDGVDASLVNAATTQSEIEDLLRQ